MLKDLYDLCFERTLDFPAVYEAEGKPVQSRDTTALEKMADELMAANPKQVRAISFRQKDSAWFFRRADHKSVQGPGQIHN